MTPPPLIESPATSPGPSAPERYDFAAPRRLAQVQMRVLTGVHEAFAQVLGLALSTKLRSLVDVEAEHVEFMPYADYVAASPSPAALFVSKEEAGQRLALDVDPTLAATLVERLLGGEGSPETEARELSSVEQHMMKRLVGQGLGQLGVAWSRAARLHPGEPRFESEAEFGQLAAGPDRVAVCRFIVYVQEREAPMALVYPLRLLERLLDRGALQRWNTGAETRPSPDLLAGYEQTLGGLPVALHAELGRARLRLADLDGLAVGDVIPLTTTTQAPITVLVRNRPKFTAVPGRTGEHLAFRILHVHGDSPAPDADPSSNDH